MQSDEKDKIYSDLNTIRDRQIRLETIVEQQDKQITKLDSKIDAITNKIDDMLKSINDLSSKLATNIANTSRIYWFFGISFSLVALLITVSRFFIEISSR